MISKTDKGGRAVSEVGHHKNVANFNLLINAAENFGSQYQPEELRLQLPQLYTVLIIAQDKLASVTVQQTAYNQAVNARKEAFKGLQELFTAILTTLENADAETHILEKARDFHRKIYGIGLVKDDTSKNKVKLSYDQAVQLFSQLIQLLETTKNYTPNEDHLSVTQLQFKRDWLIRQNMAKTQAYNAIKKIRIERNVVLYHPQTGLLAIAEQVKNYMEANFGSSPQFKKLSKLRFKKPKL